MYIILLIGLLLFSQLAWNQVVEVRAVSRRRTMLAARQVYADPAEWLEGHWNSSTAHAETINRVCELLARRLEIHSSQLYGSDRFQGELALHGPFLMPVDIDLAMIDLDEDLQLLYAEPVPDLANSDSLEQLVRVLSECKSRSTGTPRARPEENVQKGTRDIGAAGNPTG